jgi:hypothetical protein
MVLTTDTEEATMLLKQQFQLPLRRSCTQNGIQVLLYKWQRNEYTVLAYYYRGACV